MTTTTTSDPYDDDLIYDYDRDYVFVHADTQVEPIAVYEIDADPDDDKDDDIICDCGHSFLDWHYSAGCELCECKRRL